MVAAGLLASLSVGCGLAESEPDLVAGKKQFAQKCSSCHILKRAGGTGTQGPNLDEAFREALADGMPRSGIDGVVEAQIDNPSRLSPKDPVYMPADLVTGRDAENVAAYVADAVAKPGEDTGLLGSAVPKPGSGKPIAAKDGTLEMPAAEAGLAYASKEATAPVGPLTVKMPNPSTTPHDIALEGNGVNAKGEVVEQGGTSQFETDVNAGKYTYFCTVPGHREGGMEGTLTVK
jgi:plastocyanin